MAFIGAHQLDIMLFMSGICAVLAIMTLMTATPSKSRRIILTAMELAAMLLLIAEWLSYIYRGDVSEQGFYMVRLSNGMVYFLQALFPWLVAQFLKDLFRDEGGLHFTPVLLQICDILFFLAAILLLVSQFTGLYYYFDAQNIYHRSHGFALAYSLPLLMVVLEEASLLIHQKRISMSIVVSLSLSIVLPVAAAVAQFFWYGMSLTSMTMVFVVIVFYAILMGDMSRAVESARKNELESSREAEKKITAMFEETALALAGAIDAKDKYTHGHSTRVATLSRQIAEAAGFSKDYCAQIYYAALLHDIGKIGIPDDIINKDGPLTTEEFEMIKSHPTMGYHILSGIKASPVLGIGAHYHHERYDGTGYPDGLRGEEIPEPARIIAVADAYDAMAFSRIYHGGIPTENAKEELLRESGKQFDPKYTEILVNILDAR